MHVVVDDDDDDDDFHLACDMLLHYLAKSKNPKMLLILTAPQQTVDVFLRTL